MEASSYACKSIEMYFQAILLMNIGVEYSALVLAIQKDWKDDNTNLAEIILQIIKYSKFIERNKKAKVIQTTISLIYQAPKRSCTNKKYIKRGLMTYYTDLY